MDGDHIRFGCITILALASFVGCVFTCTEERKWDSSTGVYISQRNMTAHSRSGCKDMKGEYEHISTGKLTSSSFKAVCPECFKDEDARELENVAKWNTEIKNRKQSVINEIQTIYPNYGDYDFRRDMSTKSGQDFILLSAKKFVDEFGNDSEHLPKEEDALMAIREFREEEYGYGDVNLYVRFLYQHCKPVIDDITLKKFELKLRTEPDFRYNIFKYMHSNGYNIGSYQVFELAVNSTYDDYKDDYGIGEIVLAEY